MSAAPVDPELLLFLDGRDDRLCNEAANVIRDLCSSLTADAKQRTQAVDALLDIAAMGKKAGSELAKHRLTEMGIDWQTGDPTPNYGSMT